MNHQLSSGKTWPLPLSLLFIIGGIALLCAYPNEAAGEVLKPMAALGGVLLSLGNYMVSKATFAKGTFLERTVTIALLAMAMVFAIVFFYRVCFVR